MDRILVRQLTLWGRQSRRPRKSHKPPKWRKARKRFERRGSRRRHRCRCSRAMGSCRCSQPCGSCFPPVACSAARSSRPEAGACSAWRWPRARRRPGLGARRSGCRSSGWLRRPTRASLLDGCELVLLRPPDRPSAQVRRRLEATVRRSGGVLVVAGNWEGAPTRVLVTSPEWTGIGAGHGRLRARRVQLVADGRGAAARPRARWLWLPGPDGSVAVADELGASREPSWPRIRGTG